MRKAATIAQRYDLLTSLTIAELTRLGLTREDIPRAAVTGLRGSEIRSQTKNCFERPAIPDRRAFFAKPQWL